MQGNYKNLFIILTTKCLRILCSLSKMSSNRKRKKQTNKTQKNNKGTLTTKDTNLAIRLSLVVVRAHTYISKKVLNQREE